MQFKNREEKVNWLCLTAKAIRCMEQERNAAIMNEQYDKAFSLLKGIKFARQKFNEISCSLYKEDKCNK
jgi:hypothetical protein